MRTNLIAIGIVVLGAAIACGPDTPTTVPPPPPAQPPPPPAQPPPPPPPQPPPPPPPGGGTATVSLTSPNADDGAILLELAGPAVHGITLSSTTLTYYIDSSAAPIRVAVLGNLSNGPLLTFVVNDTTAMSSYSATAKDVASRQNQLRSGLTGYQLKITH